MIRTGRKNGHTIYDMANDDEPSEDDVFLGAMGTPEAAADIVHRYNLVESVLAENRRLQEQVREMTPIVERAEHWRETANALQQAPVLTPEAKADTEAAFQRGVEHARGLMGQSRYAQNRKGILLVGEVASLLQRASNALNDAVKELSTDDEPPADPEAPDEADDGDPDCRCHLAKAVCRKHDVGRV